MGRFYGPDGEPLDEVDHVAIMRCPHRLLMHEQYRPDGSRRCDDPTHKEMLNWRFKWEDGRWRPNGYERRILSSITQTEVSFCETSRPTYCFNAHSAR
jgi:hypothetical protein